MLDTVRYLFIYVQTSQPGANHEVVTNKEGKNINKTHKTNKQGNLYNNNNNKNSIKNRSYNNSILYYFCTESTATKPITNTAQSK
jgi:hypothetical protein